MSNVTLTIAGRDYVVGCAAGEEDHIAELGQMIDARLSALPPTAVQGESRALLFAALLLADEVFEARKGDVLPPAPENPFDDTAAEEVMAGDAAPLPAAPLPPQDVPLAPAAPAMDREDDTDRLADLALHLENLATLLEDPLEDRLFRA